MSFPKIEGYVVTEKLGSGSYSTVYKAYTKVGGRRAVAIKCVQKERVKLSGAAADSLVQEISLMKKLTHPHIVQLYDFTWDAKNIYIIMEYCSDGDLSRYIKKYGRVPENMVRYFLQQLASALKYLREKDVVHMDLKPANLLLTRADGRYTLKVADFGLSVCMSSMSSVRGSPLYMAPEIVTCRTYDARVDLWSIGVIMYECLFGKAPYSSASVTELLNKIQNKHPIQLPPHSSISPPCLALLRRLLVHEPEHRITYEEFFNHPYLDLDHMPSKENYLKAVDLIRSAIALEQSCLRSSLRNYAEALAILSEVLRVERDERRSALSVKIHTYIERAEHLKKLVELQKNGDVTTHTHTHIQPPPEQLEIEDSKLQDSSCDSCQSDSRQCQCQQELPTEELVYEETPSSLLGDDQSAAVSAECSYKAETQQEQSKWKKRPAEVLDNCRIS